MLAAPGQKHQTALSLCASSLLLLTLSVGVMSNLLSTDTSYERKIVERTCSALIVWQGDLSTDAGLHLLWHDSECVNAGLMPSKVVEKGQSFRVKDSNQTHCGASKDSVPSTCKSSCS